MITKRRCELYSSSDRYSCGSVTHILVHTTLKHESPSVVRLSDSPSMCLFCFSLRMPGCPCGSGFRVLNWVLSGELYHPASHFGTFFFRNTEPQPHHHYMVSSLCSAKAMRASVAVVLALGCGNLIEGQQFGPLSQLFSSSSNSKNSSDKQASGSSGFISISDAHSFADQLRCTEFIPLGILRLSVACFLSES